MGNSDILARIVEHKRTELARLRSQALEEDWAGRAQGAPEPPDFLEALRRGRQIHVIAEIKRASPSAGVICEDFDPPAIARSYAEHGADCISVLTDAEFFGGSIEHLRAVGAQVRVPLLRKDFILDPLQIYEARLAGASAVLLIAECLEQRQLAELIDVAHNVQLTALVELYDPDNLPNVIDAGARLIGVNNRNLRTFETDLNHTLRLRDSIPSDRTVVSESGIKTREDIERLAAAGVDAILVGEAFMRAEDPGKKLAELLGN